MGDTTGAQCIVCGVCYGDGHLSWCQRAEKKEIKPDNCPSCGGYGEALVDSHNEANAEIERLKKEVEAHKTGGCNNINPDYTSPVAYCELMEWMQNKHRAEDFDCFITSLGYIDLDDWLKLTRKKQVILIAEAIQAGAIK